MDICFYRVKVGLTQQQCADIIGCNLRTWLRLEKSDDNKYIPEKYMFYEKTKKFLGEKKMKDQFSVVRPARKRAMTRSFNGEGAGKAIIGFGKGMEVFGFNKGQFSIVDIIEAVLEITGPAHAVVATWTAASADLSRIQNFLERNKVITAQWVVDYSFETRQPKFCAQLRETFGDECIRTTASHCKFVLIKNDEWNVVIQTSMNLNQNKRMENFWVCDDKDMYESFSYLVSDIFQIQKPGEGFGDKPSIRRAEFDSLGAGVKSAFFDVKKASEII